MNIYTTIVDMTQRLYSGKKNVVWLIRVNVSVFYQMVN